MFATSETPVLLIVPADPSFLRIVRLVVSSLAADLDFDFEEVEDLRIASDELVSALVASATPSNSVQIAMTSDAGVLGFRAETSTVDGGAVQLDPLATQIVSGIVASFRSVVEGTTSVVEFRSNTPRATERAK